MYPGRSVLCLRNSVQCWYRYVAVTLLLTCPRLFFIFIDSLKCYQAYLGYSLCQFAKCACSCSQLKNCHHYRENTGWDPNCVVSSVYGFVLLLIYSFASIISYNWPNSSQQSVCIWHRDNIYIYIWYLVYDLTSTRWMKHTQRKGL